MRYAFLRGLQVFGMVVIISGLTTGIRMRNMSIELSALAIGAGIFSRQICFWIKAINYES